MKLKKLQLENFRNYLSFVHEFPSDKGFTVLVGKNGKGKTNLLEAVYLLSLGRSFRTLIPNDLIKWDQDYLRLQGEVEIDDENTSLEVFYSATPIKKKNFKKNDVSLKNSEYIGTLLTVLFHPEDLNMLYLSPQYRRKYLNILLSQTDREYLLALTQYNKVLKQRNALLHQIKSHHFKKLPEQHLREDLDTWDEQLANYGSEITQKRLRITKHLNKIVEKHYQQISGNREKIRISYKTRLKIENNTSINLKYRGMLLEKRENDIFKEKTTFGPHLDDLCFKINGILINKSASRGEFRTLLLAIKLSEIDYIREITGNNPILLLDDVFSELDRKRQHHLLKAIESCQTIITTTESHNLQKIAEEKANFRFVNIE